MMTATFFPDDAGSPPLAPPSLQGLAELRLLPSRILHTSRLQQYDPDSHCRALLEPSPDPAVVHRHWSADILEPLGIDDSVVPRPRHNALPVALLPVKKFETLATW